jgi:extradiol dioxygenase family protein
MFHLAIPITDVIEAKKFYCQGLGCEVGRETEKAIILNFYGHQVVAHVSDEPIIPQKGIYPRHFGLVFQQESQWDNLVEKLKGKDFSFYVEPKERFLGQITQHKTFFIQDPFHNLLEFKYYRHAEAIFGSREVVEIGDRV